MSLLPVEMVCIHELVIHGIHMQGCKLVCIDAKRQCLSNSTVKVLYQI